MSSIDPTTMAKQLATYEVQPFQTRYSAQTSKYQSQLSALSKVEASLKEFKSTVTSINSSTNSIIKNKATVSEEGILSASVNSNALTGNYQIFVEQTATAHQISADMPTTLDAETEVPTTGTLEFTIDGETMILDLTTLDSDGDGKATIADLTEAINKHADNPGVNATLVRSSGQTHFMLASEETGVANAIHVNASATGEAWFENAITSVKEISAPQDAVIWLGAQGTGLRLTESNNTFNNAIEGVDITINKAQESSDTPLSLQVGADNAATKDQVNKFVSAYNNLISTIETYSKVKDEDSARPVLASDPTLKTIESQLKSIVRSEHGGTRLSELGIEIDRQGKMSIDAKKFEKAQSENSAGLEALFNGEDNLLDSVEKFIEPYTNSTNGLFKTRKDSINQNIDRISDKQTSLERKYTVSYDRYLKQFTQMNAVMTQMQQTMTLFG